MGETRSVVSEAVCGSVDVLEVDSELRIESKSSQRCVQVGAEAESCSKEVVKEPCNDTLVRPCAASNGMEVFNDSEIGIGIAMQEKDAALEYAELNFSAECQREEVSNDTELRSLVEIQVKEVRNSAELEACTGSHVEEVARSMLLDAFAQSRENASADLDCLKILQQEPNDAQVEPAEAMDDSEIKPCAQDHTLNMYNCNSEPFYGYDEVKHDLGLEPCPKNKVKEASNDDIYSEVSNPNQSPRLATSSLTISSQLLDAHGNDHGGCGETTSACSRNSALDGSCHEAEHNRSHKTESVSKSSFVLEIPKHVSTTGIRKITFKFTKCKEDCDSGRSVVKPKTADDSQGDYYDNQLSFSDSQLLTNNVFVHHDPEMSLSIDGGEFHGTQSPLSCIQNRELHMSKKITPDSYPTNVQKLLSTRILEGARVKYISRSGLVSYILYFCLVTAIILMI